VRRWHGRERTRPLRAMREYVEAVRALLAGGRVTYEGEVFSVGGFGLEHDFLAAPDAGLYVAALGEKMLQVGSEVGDGVLLNWSPVEDVPRIRVAVDAAAAAAGRDPASVRIAGDLRVGVGSADEVRQMREEQRKQTAFYGNVPPYNRFYAEAGYADVAAELREAWAAGDRSRAIAAIPDEMLDAIVAIGDPETVQRRIHELWEAGMDEVILFPLTGGSPAGDATRRIIDIASQVPTTTAEVTA